MQEKGNVPYVVENGAGIFTRCPDEIARRVSDWFTTKRSELKRMSKNARKLAKPNAVFDIVNDIHKLACRRSSKPPPYTTTLASSISSSSVLWAAALALHMEWE
ncbi:hypothetical protein M569_10858 [Genlisea aurea]|uniref:Glycosyl transferase family 28 C-terminal domain-containing protein n=1 Tax=Genlisea aurea TaxID=192259 RepID=S8DVK4_9LAMI|nr:hypothetical protein M569_10858 [Genlisea aurea]